jgi:hypothetical protein
LSACCPGVKVSRTANRRGNPVTRITLSRLTQSGGPGRRPWVEAGARAGRAGGAGDWVVERASPAPPFVFNRSAG